jgi:hypothetical protein
MRARSIERARLLPSLLSLKMGEANAMLISLLVWAYVAALFALIVRFYYQAARGGRN